MTEQCWALVGRYDEKDRRWRVALRRRVSGQPASVEADWKWTLKQEEAFGDVVGFAHTHPPGAGASPSERDVRTMQAWCSALGKPLLCLIDEGSELTDPSGYIFDDDRSIGRETQAFEIITA